MYSGGMLASVPIGMVSWGTAPGLLWRMAVMARPAQGFCVHVPEKMPTGAEPLVPGQAYRGKEKPPWPMGSTYSLTVPVQRS